MQNFHSGKYLNVDGDQMQNGANVHQWDNPQQASSQWVIERRADSNYNIKNVHSGKYLNVDGDQMNSGANVHQWDNPEEASTQWVFAQVRHGPLGSPRRETDAVIAVAAGHGPAHDMAKDL
mmetsp:Transcript_71874/g.232814  ORF Transcript_71874/g.232814 Transcript_71874/m.232814 type:complete len:121 (+) Transcript_71874:799-1161(+)